MTLNVGLLIKANATQAKAELASVADRTKAFGTQTRNAGNDARQAAAAMAAYEARIAAMEAELRLLIATQGAANDKARQTVPAFNGGAQAVGSMVAQFNDIGVMLAAGQNPLQLAIQQGTQITQGFGGRGAAGAVQLLKQGFMAMISPVNLGTMAILAGGTALVQWAMGAMGAEEETVSLKERLDSLSESMSAYEEMALRSKAKTIDLAREFGLFADNIRGFSAFMGRVEMAQVFDDLSASITPLKGSLGDIEWALTRVADARKEMEEQQAYLKAGVTDPIAMMAATLELQRASDAAIDAAAAFGITDIQAQSLFDSLDALGDARSQGSMRGVASAAEGALIVLQSIENASGELPAPLREAARALNEMMTQAAAIEAAINPIFVQTAELARAAGIATQSFATMYSAITTAAGAAIQLSNSAPDGGWMNAAIQGVNGLIGRLATALGIKNALSNYNATLARTGQDSGPDSVRATLNGGGRFTPVVSGAGLPSVDLDEGTGTSGAGRSGGGGAARAERDAVAELIAKLREEQAVLAELDPVKAQMLRYREQLSTATAAERAEVEALIMVREREKALDQLGEFGANSVVDLLKSIRGGADAVSDSLKKVLNNLLDMGIQALILGKGPLAQLFGISGNIFQGGGGGGGGGLLGGLLGGLFGGGGGTGKLGLPAFADGMVFGPGGGRDDQILARISAGESIINARATARHRPLLERINAGLPRFADGMVGGGGGIGAAGAPVLHQTININGATGNGEIAEMVAQGVQAGVEEFSRNYLPQRILQVNAQPRRRNY